MVNIENLMPGGNALLWAVAATDLGPDNFLRTKESPWVLKNMAAKIPQMGSLSAGEPVAKGLRGGLVTFQYNDVYSVAIARNAAQINEAINSRAIPQNRKPEAAPSLYGYMGAAYPSSKYSFVLVCWDHNDVKHETMLPPVLFYTHDIPKDWIEFYMLDYHGSPMGEDGTPDLNEEVAVDHSLITSFPDMDYGNEVDYDRRTDAGLLEFLPKKITGGKFQNMTLTNGDMRISRDNFEAGKPRFERVVPYGFRQGR